MLTKIEISGFKTFDNFKMDVNPFLVILGANASGKSNLFDAIRFLSSLAENDLSTAVKEMRGELYELFRRQTDGKLVNKMFFAVEVLLEPKLSDAWGTEVRISHSRIRYELEIERRQDERQIERVVVSKESAKPILACDDNWQPNNKKPSKAFKERFLKYNRRTNWLSTETEGKLQFHIHEDIQKGRSRPANSAEATILSSITCRLSSFIRTTRRITRLAISTIESDSVTPSQRNDCTRKNVARWFKFAERLSTYSSRNKK